MVLEPELSGQENDRKGEPGCSKCWPAVRTSSVDPSLLECHQAWACHAVCIKVPTNGLGRVYFQVFLLPCCPQVISEVCSPGLGLALFPALYCLWFFPASVWGTLGGCLKRESGRERISRSCRDLWGQVGVQAGRYFLGSVDSILWG